jgi:hypothetical protein
MTLTTIVCIGLVTLTVAAQHPRAAQSLDRNLSPGVPIPCEVKPQVEQQYAVTGKVKLLLIWTGAREVGQARFARLQSLDGDGGLMLLVGTDPDRAPMRLNRWGYIAETTCNAERRSSRAS